MRSGVPLLKKKAFDPAAATRVPGRQGGARAGVRWLGAGRRRGADAAGPGAACCRPKAPAWHPRGQQWLPGRRAPASPVAASPFPPLPPPPLPADCPVACIAQLEHSGSAAPGQPTSIQDFQTATQLAGVMTSVCTCTIDKIRGHLRMKVLRCGCSHGCITMHVHLGTGCPWPSCCTAVGQAHHDGSCSPPPPPPLAVCLMCGRVAQVVVHNLPWTCSWQQLKDAFLAAGVPRVERADVIVDSAGRSRCRLRPRRAPAPGAATQLSARIRGCDPGDLPTTVPAAVCAGPLALHAAGVNAGRLVDWWTRYRRKNGKPGVYRTQSYAPFP